MVFVLVNTMYADVIRSPVLLSQLFENCPCLEKCLNTVPSVFTANAGVLESTPRRLRIVRHAVDHDAARPQLRGHATCSLDVFPDNGGMKAIFRVVGDPYRVFLGIVCDDTEYGAK